MINFYEEKQIAILKHQLILFRILFYSVLTIFVTAETVLSCFLQYKNSMILTPIIIILGIIFSILLPFLFFYFIYPNKWLISRIKFMNDSFKHEISGVVTSIQQNKTLRRNICGKEILINSNNTPLILYLEDNNLNFIFEINKNYTFFVCDNFIVSAEESKNE